MAEALVFDVFIALVLGGLPLFVVWYFRYAKKHHRSGATALSLLAIVVWGALFFAAFIEPRRIVVREYTATIGQTGHQLHIALISDLHLGPFKGGAWSAQLTKRINALQPEAVILAGDLASTLAGTRGYTPFRQLIAPHGAFAVLGNWDYIVGAVDVRHAIESAGVEMLTNESINIGSPEAPFFLVGLDDYKFGTPDWDMAMAAVPPGAPYAIVAHNPSFAAEAEVRGVPLLLAGHTHGGQIRLPGIGAIVHLPIDIDQRFDQGLLSYGPVKLLITPGVGESYARLRFFDPPEISFLTLNY